jgi:hypothetical protein
MKKDNKFGITCPPGSIMISIALGLVYDWKVAFITLVMFLLLGTIMENFL